MQFTPPPAYKLKLNALIGLSVLVLSSDPSYAMERVRNIIGVDALQRDLVTRIQTENITVPGYTRLNQSGSAKHWLYGMQHTGQGVEVQNHEMYYIDHKAFQEQNADGSISYRFTDPNPVFATFTSSLSDWQWKKTYHGTATAAIIGGNGWGCATGSGESGSYPDYNTCGNLDFRGIAPGVKFSLERVFTIDLLSSFKSNNYLKDVNNFSMTLEGYFYSPISRAIDSLESQHQIQVPIIQSTGNEGVIDSKFPNRIGYFSSNTIAKNSIKVGETYVNLPFIRSETSAMGPLYDGRIGVDVMAPSAQLITAFPNKTNCNQDATPLCQPGPNGYESFSGTSAAAPIVSGVTALMIENYVKKYEPSAQPFRNRTGFYNSTIRGILIHTATDITGQEPEWLAFKANRPKNPDFATDTENDILTEGPDFSTGYGLVNAKKAVEYSEKGEHFIEDHIRPNETHRYMFKLKPTDVGKKFRITLAWDDPKGVQSEYVPGLKNDLDIQAWAYMGPWYSLRLPWKLDGNCLYNLGVQKDVQGINKGLTYDKLMTCKAIKKDDHVNNVEVIDFEVENFGSGIMYFEVKGNKITEDQSEAPGTNQDYSIVFDIKPEAEVQKFGGSDALLTGTTEEILHFTKPGLWSSYPQYKVSYGQNNLTVSPYEYEINMTHTGQMNLPIDPITNPVAGFLSAQIGLTDPALNQLNDSVYMGNLQFFLRSEEKGIWSEYIGQMELWCGKDYQCATTKKMQFAIPAPIFKKLTGPTNQGKFSIRMLLSSQRPLFGKTVKISDINFHFKAKEDLPTVDCSNIPYANATGGQFPAVIKETIRDLELSREHPSPEFSTYRFACIPGYTTSPWCWSSTYKPHLMKNDDSRCDDQCQQAIDQELPQYWPAAFEITGVCQ